MNKNDINNFLNNPELVTNASKDELRRLIEAYPYCEVTYWIYLRLLYIHDDAIFEDELMKYGLYISNRRLFYNYLTFENTKEQNNLPIETEQTIVLPVQTPDYFALEQNQTQKQSLQQLAEQLKKARLAKQKQTPQDNLQTTDNQTIKTDADENKKTSEIVQKTEDDAKKLIKEQKYLEAIEILRAISLNNPKKSANFALQIKFLETIINNHNKN